MSDPAGAQAISWLQPSWPKLTIAAAAAAIGFSLPQEVPLEWYPLNEPGTDINYLEISCAADKDGDVQIFYNLSTGIRQINSIYFPISPTAQTFTYTFPLPDGPITELRIDPVAQGGALTIRQMRIINRRSEEVRRFTWDMFRPQHEIAEIAPLPDGWRITSTATATDPYLRVEIVSPIIPVGKDHRNLLRSLLSTSYLAGMLLILLLALLFATWRPRGWRDFFVHAGFMAGLALLFAFVGNRGLIKNSITYARYVPTTEFNDLFLELDLRTSRPAGSQLFIDTGNGYSESGSVRVTHETHEALQTLRFPLGSVQLHALRFDPQDGPPASMTIRGIRVVDSGRRTRTVLPLSTLQPVQHVRAVTSPEGYLTLESPPEGTDPILVFTPEAISQINTAITAPSSPER